VVQADRVEAVVAQLQPEGVAAVAATERGVPAAARRQAEHVALLGLLELVAVHRIVQEEREVRVQVQARLDRVGIELETAVGQPAFGLERQAVARGVAAVGRIDRAEAADQALIDRALRNLVGRVPVCRIRHRGERRTVAGLSDAVAQHAVDPVKLFRVLPRAVVVRGLERVEQVAVSDAAAVGDERAAVAMGAEGERCDAARQRVEQADVGRAGGREVALVGVVRALLVADPVDELGQQPVEIGVAVAVRVRRHVDRHAGDEGREVGAVVEVEAAQEVLVRLAVAAVLRDDHAGHELEQLGRAQRGPALDQLGRDRALAGRVGAADGVVVVADHGDRGELHRLAHRNRGDGQQRELQRERESIRGHARPR
jgi:hypothetical protein